jgi:hypothetical protein
MMVHYFRGISGECQNLILLSYWRKKFFGCHTWNMSQLLNIIYKGMLASALWNWDLASPIDIISVNHFFTIGKHAGDFSMIHLPTFALLLYKPHMLSILAERSLG